MQALMLYCVMFSGDGQTHSDQGKDNKHYKDINKSHFYSSPSSSDSAQIENTIFIAYEIVVVKRIMYVVCYMWV